jgi:hypothetical protein
VYSLKIERKAAYLQATATGILNAETDKQIDEELVQICQDEGYRALLIDIRPMKGRLSIVENYQAAATLRERSSTVLRRIAIVDRDRPEDISRNRFFEDVAVNRGAMVRFFTGIRAASAWLRQEGSQSLQTKGVDSDEE